MRMCDLTIRITEMSEEQLIQHVRKMRANKSIVKPAHVKRKTEAVKRTSNQRMSKASKLVESMSDADRQALLQLLGDGDE